jgi:Flp pilus assembly pilin Flp
MSMLHACLKTFLACEGGSTAIEYGLIAAFIGMGIILSLTNVRDGFGTVVNTTTNALGGR